MVLLHEELLEDLEVYGGSAKEVKPRCQLCASMSRKDISDMVAPVEGRRVVRAFLMEMWRRERRDGIVKFFVFLFFSLGCVCFHRLHIS